MSIDLTDSNLYFDRELSWFEFNKRVLGEALNNETPLLERLKFLSIFSTNLDEFFMIRVAGIKQQLAAGVQEPSAEGYTPQQRLKMLAEEIRPAVEKQMNCFTLDIMPKLNAESIIVHSYGDLNNDQKTYLDKYFRKEVFPILTPLGFDPGRPFPHLLNVSLYIAFYLNDPREPDEDPKFSIVQIPQALSRLITIAPDNQNQFVLLEDLICQHARRMFLGHEILESYPFRITRDCDFEIAEDEADDLLETVQIEVKKRRWGKAVRLEVIKATPEKLRSLLAYSLNLDRDDVYEIDGPLNIPDFMQLYSIKRPDLKDKPFTPKQPRTLRKYDSIFEAIRANDILLHHPFESFNSVVEFIRSAAEDPNVMAIKQTMYRTGGDSPIIRALSTAVENGKQVAALVELKARFDEENNIVWARTLAKAGVHVVYGLVGLKTHCKAALVVRREPDGIRRYVHLSTGNYNPTTARIYTDIGLMTCNPDFAEDVSHLFNYLTGYSHRKKWRKLMVAPMNLRDQLKNLVYDEIESHKNHKNGHIILKMNSLLDPDMVRCLYHASQAGVKIDLIIRGICSLRPGVKNVSENIRVISIVGRFLEHSRIFYFYNNGDERLFLGSADWMQRNLNRRVETVFPVEAENLKKRLLRNLELRLRDNVKAHELKPDGSYEKIKPGKDEPLINSQEILLKEP